MGIKVTITEKTNIRWDNYTNAALNNMLHKITAELIDIGTKKAIEHYKERRIKSGYSRIISGFTYKLNNGTRAVKGKIYTDVPYAIYVDEIGWKTKKGQKEGYNFMLAGVVEIVNRADAVIEKHLAIL